MSGRGRGRIWGVNERKGGYVDGGEKKEREKKMWYVDGGEKRKKKKEEDEGNGNRGREGER